MSDDKKPMSAEDYSATQSQLLLLAGVAIEMDLPAFLERIQHSETVAPLLDPTLYMRGAAKLEQVRRLAAAANTFRAEVLRQRDEEIAERERRRG